MALIRGHHTFDDQFAQIPNAWLRDSRLSLKAIGLLAQIMSHSAGWSMSIRSLARVNGNGTDTIKAAVLELEKFGYLRRSKKQTQNADGTFADYKFVTASPYSLMDTGQQGVTQNPVTVKPRHGETGHKEYQEPIEEQSTKNSKRTTPQKLFDEFWKEYPRKLDKGKAFKAFLSAISRERFENILAGAIQYKSDPNRIDEFTKYPASWLNADSWDNGPLPEDSRAKKLRERTQQEKLMKEWGNESE